MEIFHLYVAYLGPVRLQQIFILRSWKNSDLYGYTEGETWGLCHYLSSHIFLDSPNFLYWIYLNFIIKHEYINWMYISINTLTERSQKRGNLWWLTILLRVSGIHTRRVTFKLFDLSTRVIKVAMLWRSSFILFLS